MDPELESRAERFSSDEAEEVLDRAADLQAEAESSDAMDRDLLTESAGEAGIAREFVDEAIRSSREEKAERVQRKATVRIASIAAVVLLVLMVLTTQASLSGPRSRAETARAELTSQIERRDTLTRQLAGDRSAATRDELVGAENRIATARRRYNEAATAYNRAAGGFPKSLFRGVLGYPKELPVE